MINVFSNRSYRRVFTAVALITVASMALTGGIFILLRTRSRRSFLTVNHHEVSQADFRRRMSAQERRLELLRMQFAQAGIPFDSKMLGIDLKQAAIQSLISDALLDEVANDLNIRLGYDYVASKITDPNFLFQEMSDYIPPYLLASQHGLDFNNISRILRGQGLSVADFERHVEEHLKLQQVKELIAASLYVPQFLLKAQYMQQFAGKKYTVLTIPYEQLLARERASVLSDDELKKFYEQSKKQFTVPETRTGVAWEFDPARYAITPSEKDVEHYYEAHKASYTQNPAQVEVRHILFKVEKPEDFPTVAAHAEAVHQELVREPASFAQKAKEISDDKATAKDGGLIGLVARGTRDAEFEQVAFKLKNDGEISQPFQTKDGIEIVQRVSRKAASYKPLSAVRAEVEKAVRQTLFNRIFAADMERIQHEMKQNPKALEQFAQTKGAKRVDLASAKLGKDSNAQVERLFKIQEVGELSIMPVAKDGGSATVIELTKIAKSFVPPFDQIKEKVTSALYRKKADNRMRVLLAEVKQQVNKRPMSELAQEFHGTLRNIDSLKGDETDRVKKLAAEGLPISQMLPMERTGSAVTNVDEQHNGLVVKLDAIEPFNAKDFEAKKAAFTGSVERELHGRLIQGFIASLERSATLSINQEEQADSQPYYPIDEI